MKDLNEVIKPIYGFNGYYVSNLGYIYSDKSGELKKMKRWADSKDRYWMISLSVDGKVKKLLVHRLVAEAFIPNPNNLPIINHKDHDPKNAHVDNLEWCTTKYNVHDSYSTMSQNRNYRKCFLYKGDDIIGEFDGIKKASRYANQEYGASRWSLEKYGSFGEFKIVPLEQNESDIHKGKKTNRTVGVRKPIYLYKNNIKIATFKNFQEASDYFINELGIVANNRKLNEVCNKNKVISGYRLTH